MTEHNSIKILALLGLAFLALCVPRLDAQEIVDITDENLEAAIRDALGIPTGPITEIDVAWLTELQADFEAITDLTGLQYCVNLTVLSLADNYISDINPLSGLKNLTVLNLSGNNISQIKPLSRLRNLTSLCLSYNNISDISPLSRLTNVGCLYLHYNNISDIGPLSRLKNLRFLYLYSNPLDFDAYLTFIPLITENNPGVDILYDPLPPEDS
jgi:Leucine-rich repeat (LRR) protein